MIQKTATFSPCRNYRYTLSRIWLPKKDFACFVCLNPSTADENFDDPTIRRCIRFAESWGYGGIVMVNLFAYRATAPKDMPGLCVAVGADNDMAISTMSEKAGITIAAWGAHNGVAARAKAVLGLLRAPKCLALTKGGHPRHPLYLKKNLTPIAFKAAAWLQ